MTQVARLVDVATKAASVAYDSPGRTMQLALFRLDDAVWSAESAALAMIDNMGTTEDTDDPQIAVESLGLVLIHAGALAGIHSLGIEPIIALAGDMRSLNIQPKRATGMLARAVRGVGGGSPCEIVESVALCIAKCVEDVEIIFELEIKPLELFMVVGQRIVNAAIDTADARERSLNDHGYGKPCDTSEADTVPMQMTMMRRIVDDPDSQGDDGDGDTRYPELPPGKRYETDEEFGARLQAEMNKP